MGLELNGDFFIAVLGLPLLVLLLTGPGMWSERWGHGALDRLGRAVKRLFGARS